MRRDLHIDSLVDGLEPASRWPGRTVALGWLAFAASSAVALTWATGPFRPDLAATFQDAPRFAIESAVAFVIAAALLLTGARMWTPGAGRATTLAGVAFAGLAAWALYYLLMQQGWIARPLEPSMAGKRPHCSFETMFFALPALAAGLWLAARRMPLSPALAGAAIGIAAAAFPIWIMQLACMYEPSHILVNHFGPALAIVLAGAIVGHRVLPRL